MSKRKTKENYYDEEISPLMAQIIEICKRRKIPVVASFGLTKDLHCTTAITPPEFEPSDMLLDLNGRIYPPEKTPLMITTRDASGQITRMDAIFP